MESLFIIGAGAGVDYDMPTGADLISKIGALAQQSIYVSGQNNSEIDQVIALATKGLNKNSEIADGMRRIARGIWFSSSIDTFINDSNHEGVKLAGKILIAYILSEREQNCPISANKFESSSWGYQSKGFREKWLTPFFRTIRAQIPKQELPDRLSKLKIINFNYDRLLENFLFQAFKLHDGCEVSEAADLTSKIEIIHPYGSLGRLPEFPNDSTTAIPFGPSKKELARQQLHKKILTFNEAVDDEIGQRTKQLVQQAYTTTFLGFGFHKQNMDLLGYPLGRSSRLTYVSSHSTPDSVNDLHSARIETQVRNRPKIRFVSGSCANIFNEYGQLLFR